MRTGPEHQRPRNSNAGRCQQEPSEAEGAGGTKPDEVTPRHTSHDAPRVSLSPSTDTHDTNAAIVMYTPTAFDVPNLSYRASAMRGAGAPPTIVPSVLLREAPL